MIATQSAGAPLLAYVAVTLAGLGAGVAVNALADQVAGDEEPPWRARDCAKCGAPLPSARLFPLLNVLPSQHTCAVCGQHASLRRPLLGLVLAVLFPLLLAHLTALDTPPHLTLWAIWLIGALALSVFAFVFAVDLEHKLILDLAVYPAALAVVATALIFDRKALAAMAFGVVLCGGLFLLFYGLGFLLYRQEALGFGDVKLAALIGLVVGWPGVVAALLVAALVGAAVSVFLLGMGTATRRTFIPFGIFLAGGAALALLLAPPVW